MARASPILLLCFVLLTVTTLSSAHPFRHPRLDRRSLHRQTSHGIHRRSASAIDLIQVGESLYTRYASTFGVPIAALERLRSATLSSIEKRERLNKRNKDVVELPFTVEELQEKLEAFVQSLSDDLAAILSSGSDFSSTAIYSPAGAESTTNPAEAPVPPTVVPTTAVSTAPDDNFSTASTFPPIVAPTTLTSVQSNVTRTVTVQQPTWTTSIQPISTFTAPSANRSAPYTFDPMATDNVVVYYGQTTQTSAVPLTEVCEDPNVDVVILAFVPTLLGPGGWPTLNLGPHCWAASTAQSQAGATGLIDCVSDGFADQVQQCQDDGKKVLLSLGGAQGYSDTTLPSDQDAEMLADQLWNLFLGGTDSPQTSAIRPFGNVVLDGIDIDNESGTTAHLEPLIATLRATFQSSAGTKPYFLSAAPQCPRPDASIPLPSMQTSLDFVWVQFYNNPSCNLASGPSFLESLSAWSSDLAANASSFVNTGNGVSSPRLYIGAPAWPGAGSGYVNADELRSLLQTVDGAYANLGGVMFWDGAFGEESAGADGSSETFMRVVKDVLG